MRTIAIPVFAFAALVMVGARASAEDKPPAKAAEGAAKVCDGSCVCSMEGHSGGCCVGRIEKSVKGIKGVKTVKFDEKTGQMSIETEAGVKVALADVRTAVEKGDRCGHGFKATQFTMAPTGK